MIPAQPSSDTIFSDYLSSIMENLPKAKKLKTPGPVYCPSFTGMYRNVKKNATMLFIVQTFFISLYFFNYVPSFKIKMFI